MNKDRDCSRHISLRMFV